MARFCPKCGAGLADAAKFCGGCGAQFPGQQPAAPAQPPPQQFVQPQQQFQQQPAYQQPYAPAPAPAAPKKKSKAPIAIGVAVLVVLLIVVAAAVGKGKKRENANQGGPLSAFSEALNGINGNNGSNNANNNGSSGGAFEYGKDFIANNLKGDYSITYKYSASDSDDAMFVTTARTSKGYYMSYGGMEMLYIKNGDKYDTYFGSTEDGFEKMSFMDPISQEEVESSTALAAGFMGQYDTWNSSDMKKAGTETVAGRKCDVYTYGASMLGASIKYTVSIDKATGVCLKSTYEAKAGGDRGSMTFECTEFKTSGVSLPKYN